MKLKTTLFAACVAVLATTTQAALTLTVSSTITFNSGTDTFGFDGSTWTFQFNSSQTNYVNTSGFASVITDSASLIVSGATNPAYNGTFAITETDTTNFASFPRVGVSLVVGYDATIGSANFDFGPAASVSFLDIGGFAPSNPGPTDPIALSDWQGVNVSDSSFLINGSNFSFDGGTVNAAVPEPSTYAALGGLGALAFVMLRRRAAR